MKKLFFAVMMSLAVFSCGNKAEEATTEAATTEATQVAATDFSEFQNSAVEMYKDLAVTEVKVEEAEGAYNVVVTTSNADFTEADYTKVSEELTKSLVEKFALAADTKVNVSVVNGEKQLFPAN